MKILPFLAICVLVSAGFSVTSPGPLNRETAAEVTEEEFDHNGIMLALPDRIQFNAHIRPIMSNTCFACHGPDDEANASGLRLDSREAAVCEGQAIEPGNAAESILIERLESTDSPMPPSDFIHQLSEYEKALFRKWIEQGAAYQVHWAYAPLQQPEIPTVSNRPSESFHPIDAFVQSRLEQEGIQPSPVADRATLLRRLSLDLTGIPPTPDQVNTFIHDDAPDAYENQVERLLASPRYGERMASRWLDIVRFSDTVGFHGDQNQRIFPYRDFVIDSLNSNQPFDEFTRDQLAGDLLENPTEQQLVATGLVRLNMMTREGGAQPGEYLAKYTADRVRMIGTAWLGATTGCCECHNHKYDPFSIRDFYSLGAFFDDVRQWGVYHNYGYTPNPDLQGYSNDHPFPPELRIKSRSLQSEIRFLEDLLYQQQADIEIAPSENDLTFQEWSRQILAQSNDGDNQWQPLTPTSVLSEHRGATATALEYEVAFRGKPAGNRSVEIQLGTSRPQLVRSLMLEVLPDTETGFVGRNEDGSFSVQLQATYQPDVDRPADRPIEMIPVTPRFIRLQHKGRKVLSLAEVQVFASGEGEPVNIAPQGSASQSSVESDGEANRAIDTNTSGVFNDASVTHTRNENNPWWELDLGSARSIQSITVWNRTDSNTANRLNGIQIQLLDENRRELYSVSPRVTNPSTTIDIPQQVSEFDLLRPEKVSFAQADRFRTNRFSSGFPSPWLSGSWVSGPGRWQLPGDEARLLHRAVFHLERPLLLRPEDRLLVKLQGDTLARARFSVSPIARFVVGEKPFPETLATALRSLANGTSPDELAEPVRNALRAAYYQYLTPLGNEPSSVAQLRDSIAKCRSGFAKTMVSQPVEPEKLRVSRVLPRGNWQDESGETVTPNTPHFLAGYVTEPKSRLTRLDLAEWLTSTDNPLTARHYVNRTWKHFFGTGLSNVLDDLGNQGEWPSHPLLLDWLAAEFQKDWDRKRITRLIVTSHTYKQQAAHRKELQTIDPYNRLLAQQSARRLEAEAIRDNALAIAGLLQDDWVGGPSVFPYQPEGYYANLQFPGRRYQTQTDGRQYRRGVYMHWQRTFLHPMLANFDAPSRDECAADRTSSNSPQQALTLLNDPVFVEASRAFAFRLLQERPEATTVERINHAFLIALARNASKTEFDALSELYEKQLKWFRENPTEATAFNQTGRFTTSRIEAEQVAALAQICRVILNLHETITRY